MASFGSPEVFREQHQEWLDTWFPEAYRFAGWWCGRDLIFLAAAHHDKETPVILELRRTTKSEIEELGGDFRLL